MAARPYTYRYKRRHTDGVVNCACPGHSCGRTFERNRWNAKKLYAEGCTWYRDDLARRNRESCARSDAKAKAEGPLPVCFCGCGLVFTTGRRGGQRFHPDCQRQREKLRARSATPPPKHAACCRRCEGLPWRRDESGCRKCGEPYEPEPPLRLADFTKRWSMLLEF